MGSFGPTQYNYAEVGERKLNNNKVMCQISMKFPAMFDQNPLILPLTK